MVRLPRLVVLLAILTQAAAGGGDGRGWTPRIAPPDPSALTTPATPQPVVLPASVGGHVRRRTVLVYLSPTCPHCVQAIPEIVALSRRISDVADTLSVMSGASGRGEVESFVADQDLPFPVIHDADRAFALATGLDATPSILVVDPPPTGTTEVLATEAWLPYVRGAGVVLEMRIRGDPGAVLGRGEATGVLACSGCHAEEARAWTATAHASATSAIARKQREDHLSCLACHVTFLDRSSGPEAGVFGFRPGDRRSPFADVGCEACHTASGPHDGDGGAPGATCVRCHDAGHGRFDPAAGLAAIDHFQANGWTDDALRERRMDLVRGLGPRPFADLPSGPTVGTAACTGCHRAEARHWRSTPHARAMDVLSAPDREPEGCVACHATPDGETGAFRTGESVGCEACHGPGGPHTKDPTAAIVSLKSPDPECAVERVCTRCHTPERDPDWALATSLPLVIH